MNVAGRTLLVEVVDLFKGVKTKNCHTYKRNKGTKEKRSAY